MLNKFIIVTLALACFLIPSSDAIQCYKCTSNSDLSCAHDDQVSKSTMVNKINCDNVPAPQGSGPATKCYKLNFEDNAGVITKRDCYFDIPGLKTDTCENKGFKINSCDVCKGDLCNSASSQMVFGFTTLAFIAVAVRAFA